MSVGSVYRQAPLFDPTPMIGGPTAIMANALNNSFRNRWLMVLYYTLSLSIVLALMIFGSLRSKPVEETITVDSNQAKTLQIAPVPVTNELPRADLDIETAGDHLAAAVIYLKRRQNQTALNALDQAKAATDRALTRRPVDSRVRQQLLATRKEIENVKELIRNGKVVNATQELKDVNLQLDSVTY